MMQGDRNQQQMMEMVGSGSQQSLQYQKRMQQNHSPSNVELTGVTGVGGIPMPGGHFH